MENKTEMARKELANNDSDVEEMARKELANIVPEEELVKNTSTKLSKEEEVNLELLFTEEDLEETQCGLGSCTPKWIQRFATKEMYMLVYCLVGMTQGMFFTYSVSVISTIEKRFKLTSKETGIILSGNDISQVLLAMFLGYYGNFGHRPRWLGVGALFTAASCITAALPHFFYGPGEDAVVAARIATSGDISLLNNLTGFKTLTMLIRILGPVFGFFIGGKCLSIWIDPTKRPNIDKKDPRWLGAWWLGFVFLGLALVVTSLPLFFFPRKLPATLKREKKKMLRQAERDEQEGWNRGLPYFLSLAKTKKEETKPTLKNLIIALKRLFKNKIWTGNLFSATVSLLALSGYWSFKPKYLENQFRKSATEANFYTGLASLVVSVVGAVISGSVLRWFRPGPRYVTGYNVFVTVFTCVGFLALMFVGCPKLDVIGPVNGSVGPTCSADCGCTEKFTPVCAQDKTTLFYSPCYAGCSIDNTTAYPIVYSDCRCVSNSSQPNYAAPIPENERGRATRGYCPEPCNGFFYYFLIQIITKTVSSTSRIGGSIVLLRSVSDEDKGLSLGVITVFISLFGFIPAPIIMGAIIDSACVVWDKSCGISGNCWLYDSEKFRKILHVVPAVLMFISLLGDIVVFHYSGTLDLYGLKEEEIEQNKTQGKNLECRCPWCGYLSSCPEMLGRHWSRCKKKLSYVSSMQYGGVDEYRIIRETNYIYGRETRLGNFVVPERKKQPRKIPKLNLWDCYPMKQSGSTQESLKIDEEPKNFRVKVEKRRRRPKSLRWSVSKLRHVFI
ncbi:solute carrier organic anion transporter family member 74D isoform X4 [Cherax quadricarinatus]|uniref:solute carrier organic anion transporter family member 74D isoform X4 n=1 Tax=Cherax quadricarinatus TaxID=27406 RepID=UPI00387EBA32